MKTIIAAAAAVSLFAAGAAMAQSPQPQQTSPSPATTSDHGMSTDQSDKMNNPSGAPLPGANSFTEAQAKSRIEANGYTDVSALKKDDKSVWRGMASKGGRSMNVAVDYKGNVVAN